MQVSNNEIALRPRFQMELDHPKEELLALFEGDKDEKSRFLLKRIDDHVFIKMNEEEAHFWSPQLHLEINKTENNGSKLYGLFGPNPTLWTFFIFLHFGIGTLFIIFGIWAYSNWSLKFSYFPQLVVCFVMILFWIILYIFGRIGKAKGKEQMNLLHEFMMNTLKLHLKSNEQVI
ncbi:GTP-binding protein [Spongiivirga citrea]|uniref:GTP-binding protein n=1 Tax=Spongiivirga citrea TaxID=1481457 RepID=A0A6M0CM64_9FLAO|nr:GTP-binding protein [Spongiivirga citrea]NER18742.1 GTP-binding protein [Spongiivirga citrea]